MTNEVIMRCQKTPEVGIRRIPTYAYVSARAVGTAQASAVAPNGTVSLLTSRLTALEQDNSGL